MRFLRSAGLAGASLLALASSSSAISDQEKKEKEAKRLETAPFHIVLVVKMDGSKNLEAIEPMKMRDRQKELDEAYMTSLKLWRESLAIFNKDPQNKGQRFTEPCPSRPTLNIMRSRVRGQKVAEAVVKELDEKWLKPLLEKGKQEAAAKAEEAARRDPREKPEFRPKGNQVMNGGFEELRTESDLADCWTRGQWGAQGAKYSVRRTKSNPHGGEHSVVIYSMSDGARPGVSANVKLPPGKYEIRYWVCADAGKTAAVQASFEGRDLQEHPINEEWRQIKDAISVDKTGFQTKLQISTTTTRVRVYLDDVEIEAVD